MVKIHYNILSWRTQVSKEVEEVPETNTYQCHIQNHIWGCHVQYTGTLAPLKYLITSYDRGTRTRILQRWIEATIYNIESSKYGVCDVQHKKIFSWLGDDVSTFMPIYSVLDTSIQFFLLCPDILDVITRMEKCHFTW